MNLRSGPLTLIKLAGKGMSYIPTHGKMCTQWDLVICEEATKNSVQYPVKQGFTHPAPSEIPEKFAEILAADLGPGVEKAAQYNEQRQGR